MSGTAGAGLTPPRIALDTTVVLFDGEPHRVAQLVIDRERGEVTLRLRLIPHRRPTPGATP